MKRMIRTAAVLALCMALIAAAIPVSAAKDEFYETAELLGIRYHIEDDAGMSLYATVQGACTDGRYAYFAVQEDETVVVKYDMKTWKPVKKAKVEGLGHANDMAYNEKEKFIVVANNYVEDDLLTILDPQTLKVTGTVVPIAEKDDDTEEMLENDGDTDNYMWAQTEQEDAAEDEDEEEKEEKLSVYSIAYHAEDDTYIAGISRSYDFAVLDKDFKQIERIKGVKTGYTRQGCDCDDEYIYFAQSGGSNAVVIYDYDGNQVDMISLGHTHEVENLFHVGKNFFLTLHYYGNSVQRMGMSDQTQIRFIVRYDAQGGSGTMKKTAVHYGEPTPLRACAFEKPGYFFGGWLLQRDYDKKVMGCRIGSSLGEWLSEEDAYNPYLYPDGSKVAKLTRIGDVQMNALWINERYTVNYAGEEAEGWMQPDTVGYDEAYTLPANEFTKEGYIFYGYTLSRDYDGRVYGYRKGSQYAEWLKPQDAAQAYYFAQGESVKRLTYDGAVTFTAIFRPAYTFDAGHETLISYIGVDEKVRIPNEEGSLKTIAAGAFQNNTMMSELVIPDSVKTIEKGALQNCGTLRAICLEGEWPEGFDRECVEEGERPFVYAVRNGVKLCLGFYADRQNADLIRTNALALDRNCKAWAKTES